jgi:hypothetical protein
MDKLSKVLAAAGILAAIVLVGLGIGWLASRGPEAKPIGNTSAEPPETSQAEPRPVQAVRSVQQVSPPPVATNRVPEVRPVVQQPAVAPSTQPSATITNWPDRLDDILGAETPDTNKVAQMFALFPQLPEEGQEEFAEHLVNLVDDPDYAGLGELIKNAKLPESVLDVLMSDLLNRPNSIKLPHFVDIARQPDHPLAEEAKDLLELYLEEDYGTDWAMWQRKTEEWLKQNPE